MSDTPDPESRQLLYVDCSTRSALGVRSTVSPASLPTPIPLIILNFRNNADSEPRKHHPNGGTNSVTNSHISNTDLCYINVSGKQYITTFSCLEKYPYTLLGERERRLLVEA